MSFADLGLARWLVDSLKNMQIHTPTAVQKHCIPKILEGKDCIGGAKTGSGKTLAFAGPILTKWSQDPYGIYGLILTPTRELALQIAEQFAALGANMNIKTCVVVGGVDIIDQALHLQRRPHIVIATPGRLVSHIQSSGEDTTKGLRKIKFLVLDEADRLLSDSFAEDLSVCMDYIPKASERQTLLFTATVTPEVRGLKQDKGDKVFVYEGDVHSVAIPKSLAQQYLFIPSYVKEAYLFGVLSDETFADKSAIVFTNTTIGAELTCRMLKILGIRSTSLHSQMRQSERLNSLGRFRAEAARVLVATDVASRGLDIPSVALVLNLDVPADADDYVHRVGRTARAGRSGESVSFVTERDVARVQNIESRVGAKMVKFERLTDAMVVEKYLKKASKAKRQARLDMERDKFGEKRKLHNDIASNDSSKRHKVHTRS